MRTVHRCSLLAAGALATFALAGCNAKTRQNANLVNGKQLFVARCGSCHTLARAGTKGTQGPNLDQALAQPSKEGFGESAIRGLVRQQIAIPMTPAFRRERKQPVMPADLVKGRDADDVAAYVASVVARPGKDQGLLATVGQSRQSSKPAEVKGGVLDIPADPSGQLAFVYKAAQAPAGPVTIVMQNKGTAPHNIAIDGVGKGPVVPPGGTSKFSATLKPGTYTYYCEVPGHREAGMLGKLTVK